ncbi:hypothetical protein CPB83DRAFT_898050 [Crepidotus variabilis]|uniref:Nephrocystin 3-like N-terminal domain-containing protein n=1 Tax=Crepidotus variabilis TaxID=179855 RepID=A0A9P6E876_9AGAR|nr:hypothetical protein CPB83DRAFT_898050 [Crepidotus variabilis]
MAMFEREKNLQFNKRTFTQIHQTSDISEILYKKSAPGAFHISNQRYDSRTCYPGTRVAVLEDIIEQVQIAAVSTIVWLYGAAGAGKSSIAQTIAEMCRTKKLLIGSFFFCRTAPPRNNARRLAASLVYQLCQTIPSTFEYIAACIQKNPTIFENSLEVQLHQLFVEPLRRACELDPELCPSHRLLILDGLDGCENLKPLLSVFGKVLQTTPIPIILLVASRPDFHISSIFDSPKNISFIPTVRIGLNDSYDVDADIRLYTTVELKQIKCSHPLNKYIPANWPTPEDIELVVQKSSGQFIFPATVVRYVEHVKFKPHERLQMALTSFERFGSQINSSPFKELDALYLQIFLSVEDVVTTLSILRHILCLENADCPQTIAFRLQLAPGDVEMYVSPLGSLIQFEGEEKPLRVFHRVSLRDFLINKERSQDLWLFGTVVSTFVAKSYMDQISAVDSNRSWNNLIADATHFLHDASFDGELTKSLNILQDKVQGMISDYKYDIGIQRDDGLWFERPDTPKIIDKLCVIDLLFKRHHGKSEIRAQSLKGLAGYFRRNLATYLVQENLCDFLVFWVFCTIPVEVSEYNNPFHNFVSTCFSIPEPLWVDFSRILGSDKTDGETYNSTFRSFLTEATLCENLLSPKQLVQAALRCIAYISSLKDLRVYGTNPMGGGKLG